MINNYTTTGNLKTLAQLCPFTDGTNVYQARALLRHYDTTIYINNCELNAPGTSQRFMSNSINEQAENNPEQALTQVYPNPAINELTIITNVVGAHIILYNLIGQVIMDEALLSSTNKVNLSKLSSGTYLYKVIHDKKIIKTDKLIISE
ncbi:MAG: T9SS type A sorting domain-containing protein [Bacteroidetes bacterium]|nr:T9SS type A sorting domain-containing protein [Bacteroidota bacterium]